MKSWASKLAEQAVLSSDEHEVFYPYGFLRGYVIPDATFRPQIVSLMGRLQILHFLMVPVDFVVVLRFGHGLIGPVLLCSLFLHYLCCWAVVRRLTEQLVPLPFLLGFRLYAQWSNEGHLWNQFNSSLLVCVLLTTGIIFAGVDVSKMVLAVFFAVNTIKIGFLTLHTAPGSPRNCLMYDEPIAAGAVQAVAAGWQRALQGRRLASRASDDGGAETMDEQVRGQIHHAAERQAASSVSTQLTESDNKFFLGLYRNAVNFYQPRIEKRTGMRLGPIDVRDYRQQDQDFMHELELSKVSLVFSAVQESVHQSPSSEMARTLAINARRPCSRLHGILLQKRNIRLFLGGHQMP